MGAWGITIRQSDDGLDLLDTIAVEQLRKVNFTVFNVSEAITLLNQTIQIVSPKQRRAAHHKMPLKSFDTIIRQTQFWRVIFLQQRLFL